MNFIIKSPPSSHLPSCSTNLSPPPPPGLQLVHVAKHEEPTPIFLPKSQSIFSLQNNPMPISLFLATSKNESESNRFKCPKTSKDLVILPKGVPPLPFLISSGVPQKTSTGLGILLPRALKTYDAVQTNGEQGLQHHKKVRKVSDAGLEEEYEIRDSLVAPVQKKRRSV